MKREPKVSVLISAHNADLNRLTSVLRGLVNQNLAQEQWELVLVDNASTVQLASANLDLSAFQSARIVREERLGLLYGRIMGLVEARADLVVFCDDDTVLGPEYLTTVVDLFSSKPTIANASGPVSLSFDTDPPAWLTDFRPLFSERHFGSKLLTTEEGITTFPNWAGGGGGAAFRREVVLEIIDRLETAKKKPFVGRTGASLASGEDNVLLFECLKLGWKLAYDPRLSLTHLIPAYRLSPEYLGRINESVFRSWVGVLDRYGVCPWSPIHPTTLPLRMARAYLVNRAWRGPSERIKWRGACGVFKGRADIWRAANS